MIAKMSKYAFVLYAAQSDDFIGRLRELGLVDITTTGWEPSEEDRQLMLDIEGCARAAEFLKTFRADAGRFDAQAAPFASGEEAYARYAAAQREAAALQAEIGRLEKAAEELRPWGAFDPARVGALAADGVVLRYFSTQRNLFDKNAVGWSAQYALAEIGRSDATVWFVVVAAPGEEIPLDAQEMKAPGMDIREAERRIAEARAGLARLDAEFSRVAVSERLLAGYAASLRERLQGARVKATAHAEAEGRLVVMEGWAEKETSDRVDALLEAYPGVVYLKGDPDSGRYAREAEEQPVRPRVRTGGRHVRPAEIRNDGPHALFRSLLHAFLRHLSQRRRLRRHPDAAGRVDAFAEPEARHDAAGRVVRHAVRRDDRRVRPAVRIVLRHQHEGVVPGDSVLRFPGPVLLHRAGHRHGADSLRHAAQGRDDLLDRGLPPFARLAGVAACAAGRECGRRTSDARSRLDDSLLYALFAGLLRDARRGSRADALLQLAGQESLSISASGCGTPTTT